MNELYEVIEAKIKASGYPRKISGAEVYDDICDQIDGKENGEYLLLEVTKPMSTSICVPRTIAPTMPSTAVSTRLTGKSRCIKIHVLIESVLVGIYDCM